MVWSNIPKIVIVESAHSAEKKTNLWIKESGNVEKALGVCLGDCDETANGHSGCDWRQDFELLSPTTLQEFGRQVRSRVQPWEYVTRGVKRDWQSYGLELEF